MTVNPLFSELVLRHPPRRLTIIDFDCSDGACLQGRDVFE